MDFINDLLGNTCPMLRSHNNIGLFTYDLHCADILVAASYDGDSKFTIKEYVILSQADENYKAKREAFLSRHS